jgi:large subunit ribosomal protein L33
MAKKKVPAIKLVCKDCKKVNYMTFKSKMLNKKEKLEFSKYCKHCKKHTSHKEAK